MASLFKVNAAIIRQDAGAAAMVTVTAVVVGGSIKVEAEASCEAKEDESRSDAVLT